MRPSQQKQNQRPFQNELVMLHKLLGGDILEQAARILDHFSAMESSKLQRGSLDIPTHLNDKLQEKCDQFETVCDQIYYVLEQSKRVLQLDWQQQKLAERQKPQQEQNASQPGPNTATSAVPNEDMGTDLTLTNMDLSMNDPMEDLQRDNDSQTADSMMVEEEDLDELLQLQRERLDRLRNVIVHGVDVETIKASQSQGKDELLF